MNPGENDDRPYDGDVTVIDAELPEAEFEIVPAEEVAGDDNDAYRFSKRLTVLSDPAGPQSSAVGALRNHLSQQHLGIGRRSLAVCSVADNVGRSITSANLAISAAQSGRSTVLVDCNLRKPELQTLFTAPSDKMGLSDYLLGNCSDAGEIVHTNVLPNLSLILGGSIPDDPQSLLAKPEFEELITGLMRSYDFTIVDCPGASHNSDARRIASVIRYALVVAKQDVSYVSDVTQLINELSSDRVSVVGTFLNVG